MPLIGILETLRDDLRYGLRVMRRSPAFTAAALASLALGIGATTAIFSLVDTLILRPLPVREPGQLVELVSQYPGDPPMNGFAWRYYERYRDQNRVFSDLVGMSPVRLAVTRDGGEAENIDTAYVVGRFFPALGVEAALGRLIEPRDDTMGSAGAAVVAVSSWYWRNRLGGDPGAIGRQLVVAGVPATIIGVVAPEFTSLQVGLRTDVWMPVAMEPLLQRPSGRVSGDLGIGVIARLKPGVSIEQAQAEMRVLDRVRVEEIATRSGDPVWRQVRMDVASASAGFSILRQRFGRPLVALLAIVAVLLLLVCANLAGLLLARGVARQGEMALRVALGAGRWRLVRQLLTETSLLSLGGCLFGLGIAYAGAGVLARIISSGRMVGLLRIDVPVQMDVRLFLFAAFVTLLTCLLAGLLPAWQSFTMAPASTLREGTGVSDSRRRRHLGRALVVADVALAVVLLSAALLFTSHLSALRTVGTGFQRDSVLLVTLDPRGSGYDRTQLTRLYRDLLGRLDSLPGVRSATLSAVTPVQGAGASRFVRVDGVEERADDRRRVMLNWIAPNYFATLATPWQIGRDFEFDDERRPRVAIVNQAMVARHFGGRPPLGRYVTLEDDEKPYEIVGVAGDAKYLNLYETAPPTMYLNAFQEGRIASQFALRTDGNPYRLTEAIRAAVSDTLRTVKVENVTTLAEQMDASIMPERLVGTLSVVFGMVGALLAAIGLYGLMAYTVARRARELAMRLALGASRGNVMRIVLQEAMLLAVAGVALALPVVALSRPLAARFVDGLPSTAGWSTGEAAALMLGIAIVAALVPAWRASRVQPLEALRRA
jgi:putative ABC transport system permease protein